MRGIADYRSWEPPAPGQPLRNPGVSGGASLRREAAAQRARPFRALGPDFYPERMLDLGEVDVEEIATALANQTDYEHRWLLDPRTGQVAFWTSDTGIDGENPVDIDELDLIPIDALPSYVWFQDMADFAEGISDRKAGRDLTQSLMGRGVFRRFKNQIYEHHPELVSSWHALRDVRAQRRAVEWLLDHELIDDSAADGFVTRHPDPDLP
jgi:hypothetical protein